jgi:hypothetical protein
LGNRAYKECKKNWVGHENHSKQITFENLDTFVLTMPQMDEMKESKRLAAEEKRKNAKPWF